MKRRHPKPCDRQERIADLEALRGRAKLSRRMGEASVMAANIKRLLLLRGLTVEATCRGIETMIVRMGEENRQKVYNDGSTEEQRTEAEELLKFSKTFRMDSRWLRRLASEGVRQLDRRTQAKLTLVADFLGLQRADQFWDEHLITFRLGDDSFVPVSEGRYASTIRKLGELLETGDYNYLIELIDKLHQTNDRLLPPPETSEPMQFWSSETDEE